MRTRGDRFLWSHIVLPCTMIWARKFCHCAGQFCGGSCQFRCTSCRRVWRVILHHPYFYDDNNTIVKGGYTFSQLCQVMDSSELLVRDCDDIACECSCYTVFPFLSFDILVYCHTLNIHNVLIFFYAGINQGMVISISLPTWINYWCIVSCLGIRNENLELQHYFSILMG
jgi:hypothetical protein